MKSTDVGVFVQDMDGGLVEQKLGAIISEVAIGVLQTNKKGQVVLTLDMSRIGTSQQLEVKHKISFKKPTENGDKSENNTTATPFYIGEKGNLTIFPENQTDMFPKADKTTTGEEA